MSFFFNILIFSLCLVPLGTGIFLSLRIFRIPDITADGSYTLGAAITAVLLLKGYGPLIILPLILLAGFFSGSVTGFIHTRFKINPILAGILVMTSLYSCNLTLMERSNIPLLNTDNLFVSFPPMGVSLFCAVILVIILNWFLHTDLGLSLRATGSNEIMASAQGIKVDKYKIAGLGLANALIALSGYLICQFQAYADINMGVGIVISGLAAVITGEAFTSLFKKKTILISLIMVVAGTILFRTILGFSLLWGVPPSLLKLGSSVFVLLVVSIPGLKKLLER